MLTNAIFLFSLYMITEMKDGVYYWCYSTEVKDEINETNYWYFDS